MKLYTLIDFQKRQVEKEIKFITNLLYLFSLFLFGAWSYNYLVFQSGIFLYKLGRDNTKER